MADFHRLRLTTELSFKRDDAFLRVGNLKEEHTYMLTIEGLIAVISLCATMFAVGYAIGYDNK